MGVLIKDMEMPKSCYECKLDLRSDVCTAFCEWNAEHPYSIRTKDRLPDCPLSEVPELCEDTVPRASVEYICRKNTVSTNPYKHEYYEKFIKFMNDPAIADFGRWQHSNGFNTALVAVQCDLDKVPSAQPERTCVNCGRTANNGGWYADGGTRCPIEEHYALPKDGFCHLWEKRNVTDDDYPERRTDG